ncbi:DUF4124 domain-containing protein [Thiolapillus sp.]
MLRKIILLGASLVLALTTAQAFAKMYRWTDDQGNVVYSQTPPPDDRPVKAIAPPPPPAENTEGAKKEVERIQEQLDNLEEERNKKKKERQKAEQESKIKAERCKTAKANLKSIQEKPPNTLWGMPDGSYQRFTVEERQKKIDALNEIIQENCQ